MQSASTDAAVSGLITAFTRPADSSLRTATGGPTAGAAARHSTHDGHRCGGHRERGPRSGCETAPPSRRSAGRPHARRISRVGSGCPDRSPLDGCGPDATAARPGAAARRPRGVPAVRRRGAPASARAPVPECRARPHAPGRPSTTPGSPDRRRTPDPPAAGSAWRTPGTGTRPSSVHHPRPAAPAARRPEPVLTRHPVALAVGLHRAPGPLRATPPTAPWTDLRFRHRTPPPARRR